MNRTKKALISMLVLGALAAVGAGTYATFTASTANSANTFATGSLVLQTKVPYNTGTACLSTGAGTNTDVNSNAACTGIIFNFTNQKPGVTQSGTINVQNVGTLSGNLAVSGNACADVLVGTYNGSNSICPVVQITIQPLDGAGVPTGNCVYPAGAGLCAFPSTKTIGGINADSAANRALGAIAAGGSQNYQISVELPDSGPGADNKYQGHSATVILTWSLS